MRVVELEKETRKRELLNSIIKEDFKHREALMRNFCNSMRDVLSDILDLSFGLAEIRDMTVR